jgi:hypothetical protein
MQSLDSRTGTELSAPLPGRNIPGHNGVRLTVGSAPPKALAAAAERVAQLGLPVRQSTILLAGLAALIGLDDTRLIRFVEYHSRPGMKTAELDLDEMIASGRSLTPQPPAICNGSVTP